MAAKVRLGLESAATPTVEELANQFIVRLESLGRTESRIREVRTATAKAIAAGINDLADPSLPERTQYWLSKMAACRKGQKKPKPSTARTKNSCLLILRTIANFGIKQRRLLYNPFQACDLFKEARRFRKVYTIEELRRIVSDDHRDEPWWMFAVLAAYTGLRSSTLRALTWSMVDWKANRIRVPAEITKTEMDVRAPIQPELKAILQRAPGVGTSPIFSVEGRSTSDRSNEMMQQYLRTVGVEPMGRSVHCFRHSVASLLTATGMTPYLVMDAVGHASMVTSKHYSRGADEYREQVKAEGWLEGEFFLKRMSPVNPIFCGQDEVACSPQGRRESPPFWPR